MKDVVFTVSVTDGDTIKVRTSRPTSDAERLCLIALVVRAIGHSKMDDACSVCGQESTASSSEFETGDSKCAN